MKLLLLFFITYFGGGVADGQRDPVLMQINGEDVLRSEYEYLTSQKLATNVNEFVDFKLKVAQAQLAGLDTTATFRQQMSTYRFQLAKSFFTNGNEEELAARQLYDQMKACAATGRVQVMHIFKRLPQTLSSRQLNAIEVQMDSLYKALTAPNSADFSSVVAQYSDDKKTSWVHWLETPDEFEKIVFALQKGELSEPFFTPQGVHIVKVIDRKEMLSFDDMHADIVRRLINRSGKGEAVKAMVNTLKERYHFTPVQAGVDELMQFQETDQTLFTLNGKAYTGADFKRFASSYPRSLTAQLDGFIAKTILDYGYTRLESDSPTFQQLIRAHKEKTLLAEISKQELSDQVLTNEKNLSAYFKAHQSNYLWDAPRYKGAVLHCVDKKTAKRVRKLLKKRPQSQWNELLLQQFQSSKGTEVVMEQGVFAANDNPYVDYLFFKKPVTAAPMKSHPFTIIMGNKKRGPDTHQEVGEVLQADFYNYCNSLWSNRLRSSAKVEIKQEVLKTVNNH